MKNLKYIASFLVLVGLVLVATPAMAVDVSSDSSLEAKVESRILQARSETSLSTNSNDDSDENEVENEYRGEERAEFRSMTRTEREETIKEMRSDIQAALIDRLGDFTDRVIGLFERTIDRMDKFADKVETVINRLEDNHEGLDLTDSKALLQIAREVISDAEGGLVDLALDIDEAILDADGARDAFNQMKELVRAYKSTFISDAHDALVEAVVSVRANVEADASDDSEDSDSDESEE